jgi:hypothetical protein
MAEVLELKDWVSAKSEGDLVEEEFVDHCIDNGWTLMDLNARFRDHNGAPIAKGHGKKITLPDYILSKQLHGSATSLPSLVAEVKSKEPVRSDGLYWLDEWRWDYFKRVCHQFGFAGLLVFKHKPYNIPNLDNFYCATLEHAEHNIESYEVGGPARNGRRSYCYKWDPDKFIPLKEFLTGELVTPIRHPFLLKRNDEWISV